jgi:hypothetical protein
VKFSELLGDPEPEPERPPTPPPTPAPAAPAPPAPPARSGLAELNVRPETVEPAADDASVLDQLTGLDEIVDDLLPSARRRNRK